MSKGEEEIELDDKTKAVFDRKGYKVLKKVSHGAFSKVYKAKRTKDGSFSAVKVMDKKKMDIRFVEEFLPRELDILKKIKNEHVLKVHDIFQSKGKIWIFMEFAPNGDLMKKVNEGPIKESRAKKWFGQVAKALNYMHYELHICHRDIKVDNVLLDEDNNAKLSDYGFARHVEDYSKGLAKTVCGTLPYYSPELLKSKLTRKPYGAFATDCWAMGVMLYYMLTTAYPYRFKTNGKPDKDDLEMMIEAQEARVYKVRGSFKELSDGVKHLIEHLLDPNPDTRYTVTKVLRHKWLHE